jgi:hypothetical protein
MDSDIVSIIKTVIQLAEVEDCENGVTIPENVFAFNLGQIIEKHNRHCIPMISRTKAEHMARHLKGLAQSLEEYSKN